MAAREVDGLALGMVAAGGLFTYAGIKGYSVPHALQALITGKPPSTGGQANPISTPTGGAPGTTGSTAGSPAAGTAGGRGSGSGGTSWSQAFLSAIGAPATSANVTSVNAWQAREGGGGANNPLNTTLSCCGGTDFNSVGVKNYPSVAAGIQASAATITGGGYGDILMALKSGAGLCGRSWAGLSTWSGGGYSSVC